MGAHALIAIVLATAAPLRAQDRSGVPAPVSHSADDLGLSIAVRAESGNQRSFRQLEPTTGEVRTYKARVYGGIGVSLGYERLFAHRQLSWSLRADYWRSLFFTSAARRLGETVETTAQRMSALAGLSFHLDAAPHGASVELLAGVAGMSFDFAMPSPQTNDDRTMQLATGDYTYASAGIGARMPLSRLELSLRTSYLMGLHTGPFGTRTVPYQPRGFDALAAIDYRLLPWFDLSVQGGLTLLLLRLDPLPQRATDAPAKVQDLYLTLGVAAKAHLPR